MNARGRGPDGPLLGTLTAPSPHVSRLWLEQGQLGGRAGPRKRKVFDVKACFEAGKETSQGFGRRHLIWLPSFRPPSRKKAGGNVSHPTPCAFHLHPPSRGHPFRTTSPAPGFLTTGPHPLLRLLYEVPTPTAPTRPSCGGGGAPSTSLPLGLGEAAPQKRREKK